MLSLQIPVVNQVLMTIVYYTQFALIFATLSTILLISVRSIFKFQEQISIDLIEKFNKIILGLSSLVLLAYLIEFIIGLIAWPEQFEFLKRAVGPYFYSYVAMVLLLALPQLFWKKKWRRNPTASFLINFLLLIHLYLERIVISVTTIMRDNF